MARPKITQPRVDYQIHLRLTTGEDDDLIAILSHAPNRAALVKAALRGADFSSTVAASLDDAATAEDLDALDGLMF